MTGTRTFYIYTLLFALGTAGAQLTPVLPPAWLCVLVGIALVPCFRTAILRPAAFVVVGALWALLRADLLLDNEWPDALESRDVVLIGTVSDLPQRGQRYLKFNLDVERARVDRSQVAFTGLVQLRWYEAPDAARARLSAGSRWRLQVRLKQPHGYYNPGGFDYEAYLYRERIRATGYVRDADGNERVDSTQRRWSVEPLRQILRDRLESAMDAPRFGGMLRALALGDRSGISDARWRVLRATGTSHLIAISGLHVGFAAGIGVLLGLYAGRVATLAGKTANASRIAALGGLLLAFTYAALSGFDVPAQRAFVMAAVFLLGAYCRRHVWNLRGLCLALAAVLILNPASVQDPGFWLSFSAVALILAWLSGRTGRDHRVLEALKLQCLLSLALVPLVAAFFGAASLVSAPANMVAVPAVMFCVVPLCLAGVVCVAFGFQGAASICLALGDRVLALLWGVLDRLAGLDWSLVPVHLEVWQSLILLTGILWMLSARRGLRKWGLLGGIALLAPASASPVDGEFRIAVLDVGQGLSTVVRTRHHLLVYDTGPRYPGGFSLAESVVIPYLRSRRADRIDVLIVSHGDNDHRGGFEDLTAAFPVRLVLSSVAQELQGAAHCRRGQSWEWDGVAFEILHPDAERPPAHNNSSCVLRIEGRYGSALLTGDIEARAEASLADALGADLKSDVLLVPHQGSATSSTPDFIDLVGPRWAIVSAGYRNRYGHPRPEVTARYRQRGIRLINTAWAGAVIADIARHGINVKGWRETRPRYWLDRNDVAHSRETI